MRPHKASFWCPDSKIAFFFNVLRWKRRLSERGRRANYCWPMNDLTSRQPSGRSLSSGEQGGNFGGNQQTVQACCVQRHAHGRFHGVIKRHLVARRHRASLVVMQAAAHTWIDGSRVRGAAWRRCRSARYPSNAAPSPLPDTRVVTGFFAGRAARTASTPPAERMQSSSETPSSLSPPRRPSYCGCRRRAPRTR